MERLASGFAVLLSRMVETPDLPLWELSSMNADERKLVVETWNETAQAYPDTASAPGLFEEQAALMPDGGALMFEGHMQSIALSYRNVLTKQAC